MFDAVVIGLGSMIGAGIFAALAPAAGAAGSGLQRRERLFRHGLHPVRPLGERAAEGVLGAGLARLSPRVAIPVAVHGPSGRKRPCTVQEGALTLRSISEARAASSTWVQTSATVATENGTPS